MLGFRRMNGLSVTSHFFFSDPSRQWAALLGYRTKGKTAAALAIASSARERAAHTDTLVPVLFVKVVRACRHRHRCVCVGQPIDRVAVTFHPKLLLAGRTAFVVALYIAQSLVTHSRAKTPCCPPTLNARTPHTGPDRQPDRSAHRPRQSQDRDRWSPRTPTCSSAPLARSEQSLSESSEGKQ